MAKTDMIPKDTELLINRMLERKEKEMIEFLNRYLSDSERNRIGEDIIRNMPNRGDIATIQMELLCM